MFKIRHIAFVCLLSAFIGCNSEMDPKVGDDGLIHNAYTESGDVFPNPERGFHVGKDFNSASASPLTAKFVELYRKLNCTLIYTGYYLTDFMESDISEAYLNMMRTNFNVLRESGSKCVLRFAYKTDMYETGHPWDAAPDWVHRHIGQVASLLQEYSDVIFCLQAGFVGVWGEWAFTDHFVQSPSTPEEHALRKEVVLDLLDALPETRQIALRTPMFKKNMFLESYADSLTLETAYTGSDLSRLCGHNDCFGADGTDMGTFSGNSTRTFWKNETRYVLMGGETCQVSTFCLCKRSLQDMEDYHWTYLNRGYNTNVLSRWKDDGCYEEVERRLGYRLSLAEVRHSPEMVPGGDFRVVISLKNTGFAAPMNPRAVELVLVDSNGNKTVFGLDDVDPRYWFAGETVMIDKTLAVPDGVSGACTLYLNLPDPEPTLHDRPRFSIRLANDGVWNETTGYNKIAEFNL